MHYLCPIYRYLYVNRFENNDILQNQLIQNLIFLIIFIYLLAKFLKPLKKYVVVLWFIWVFPMFLIYYIFIKHYYLYESLIL